MRRARSAVTLDVAAARADGRPHIDEGERAVRTVADVHEIPRVRRWVVTRAQEEGASAPVLRTVALLATEAFTNAVRHGPRGGPVEVAVKRAGAVLRVSVTDASTRAPVVVDAAPPALGGRGMMLIDRLSAQWGVDPKSGGKTVWFEVPVE